MEEASNIKKAGGVSVIKRRRWLWLGLLWIALYLVSACSSSPNSTSDDASNKPTSNEPASSKLNPGETQHSDTAPNSTPKPSVSEVNVNASKDAFKTAKIVIKDESDLDPTLQKFLAKLKQIVEDRNVTGLLQMLAKDVNYSFGDGPGKEGFKKYWNLEKPNQSKVWTELQDILFLGGSFRDKESLSFYTAPYIFEKFPAGYDSFLYSAIIGNNVNVRATPSLEGEVVDQLSFVVVKNDGPPSDQTLTIEGTVYHWIPIVTPSGKHGFVIEKYVRSPIDYRIGIGKSQTGEWEINFFVAGD
jgi:hypothetical protein